MFLIVYRIAVCEILQADDERIYAYVRFETGDEMSRRAKFALYNQK